MPSKPSETLEDLIHYSAWASKKLLDFTLTLPDDVGARAIPNSHGGILKTFQHIFYADRVWLARLEQTATEFNDPDGGHSLKEMEREWWPLLERFAAYAVANDPDEVVTFRRTNGDPHSLERGKILRHVVNHGTYHRGQIASMLRQSGFVPPSTDLLFYELSL